MPVTDDLGNRMKEYYEKIPKTNLMRRTPVAIRIDGRAFHNFCRGFGKPFDDVLIEAMQETTKYLCENVQGCVFGYTQSDEITLILQDYKTPTTSAWFDYEVQKMCSITASMATMKFNQVFEKAYLESIAEKCGEVDDVDLAHDLARKKGAMFDARCFSIPKEEVCNLILWRQNDATRNSILMVGQANFSHRELQGKTCNQIQDMLMLQKNINWNDFPTYLKRGTACYKVEESRNEEKRSKWIIDKEMPILKNEDREYVEKHIYFE